MKYFAAILILGCSILSSASAQQDSAFFTLFGHPVRGYVGTALKASTFGTRSAGWLDLNAAISINDSWNIGIGGSGLCYDRKLSELVTDGTYHIYAGYAGVLIEKNFRLSEDLNANVALLAGAGRTYYQYDRAYREKKLWKDEIIDETTFSVMRPSVTIEYRVTGNLWIGVTGSYLQTSPVELVGLSDDAFRSFAGGLSVKYGAF
jgi:hypothetical protein